MTTDALPEVDGGTAPFTTDHLDDWLAGMGIDGHWRKIEVIVGQTGPRAGEVFVRVERHVRDNGQIVGRMNPDTQLYEPLLEAVVVKVDRLP